MRNAFIAGLLLLLSTALHAQTKSTISASSLTVVTGTVSASATVDKQDSVIVYGTYARWNNASAGAVTTVTRGAIVKLGLDSLKTYQNLFINVTGRCRTKIAVSVNDTTYRYVKTSFLTANGRSNRWQTVPIRRSVKYIRFEFLKPTSRFRLNEIAVTK